MVQNGLGAHLMYIARGAAVLGLVTLLPLAVRAAVAGDPPEEDPYAMCVEGTGVCMWLVVTDSSKTGMNIVGGKPAQRQCSEQHNNSTSQCLNCESGPGGTCRIWRIFNGDTTYLDTKIGYQKKVE